MTQTAQIVHHLDDAARIFHKLLINGPAEPVLNPKILFPVLIIQVRPVEPKQFTLLANAKLRVILVNEQNSLLAAYSPSFFLNQAFST